jgi:hypothetical protein
MTAAETIGFLDCVAPHAGGSRHGVGYRRDARPLTLLFIAGVTHAPDGYRTYDMLPVAAAYQHF